MNLKNNKKGILFWITGLSGSGKSALSKKIAPYIKKNFGKTLIFSGDDLRLIFHLDKYDIESRLQYLKFYHKFCKKITDQKINLVFSVVGLSQSVRNLNKEEIDNYIEIYIKSNIKTIQKNKKKNKIYSQSKNIWGVDIKPEYPVNPTIVLNNNFDKNINVLSKILIIKIKDFFLKK